LAFLKKRLLNGSNKQNTFKKLTNSAIDDAFKVLPKEVIDFTITDIQQKKQKKKRSYIAQLIMMALQHTVLLVVTDKKINLH
jgi:hypothetical protein